MSLKIVVCVKTVIQLINADIENRTLTNIRKSLSCVINGSDIKAIKQAVEVKSHFEGASITVISMGPLSTKETLQSLYAYGVDQVILLSDLAFAGADTLATASVLAKAIQRLGFYNLILCGKASEDGGTGQVGPQIAELLNIPHATDVENCKWGLHSVICDRFLCAYRQTIEMNYPCLVIVNERDMWPINPTLQDMVDSMHQVVLIWNQTDIGICIEMCGRKGSATKVKKIYFNQSEKNEKKIMRGSVDNLAHSFLDFIREVKEKYDSGQMESVPQMLSDVLYQPHGLKKNRPVWVYIEHSGDTVADGMNYLLHKGEKLSKQLHSPLTAIIIGYQLKAIVNYLTQCRVDKILVIDNETLSAGGEQELAEAMNSLIQEEMPQIILFGATAHGRSLAPRLAVKLQTGLTADCLDVEPVSLDKIVMTRPAYSGRILAEIVNKTLPVIVTLRLQKVQAQFFSKNLNCPIPVYQIERAFPNASYKCIAQEKANNNYLSQDKFSIVIGVGAGVGHRDNLHLFHALCALLHADIMASRETVMKGWMEPHTQIGISGHSIAPTIYVACGVSGAIQHMLGVQEAKYIIAINNNIDAPIFDYASLGLLGDIKEILPTIFEMLCTNLPNFWGEGEVNE